MSTPDIEADYLVIGTGATAMAFVDTLLSENADATVVMVDRQHRPGGHWNDAYAFVRLHQPSECYGVASRELSHGTKDVTGSNAGLYGLASGAQVLAYFDQVMQQSFLPSARVRWLPMSEYSAGADGKHQVRSLTSGDSQYITVRKKVVNATHAQTAVPSTHPPKYAVAAGVNCVPLNRLPQITRPHAAYTVVGSGKTGMDAILWLLENGVAPSRIRWVMPRDAWLMNRADFQPGIENFERSVGSNIRQFEAIAKPDTIGLMMQNQLPADVWVQFLDTGVSTGLGHGLAGAVAVAPVANDPAAQVGEVRWGGIAGTQWWISPRSGIAVLMMAQRQMAFWHPFALEFKRLAYQAMGRG